MNGHNSSVKQHVAGPGFDQNNETSAAVNAVMKVTERMQPEPKFEIEYTKLSPRCPRP